MEELAKTLVISHSSVSTILHEHLGIHKLTVRWDPKSLIDEEIATTLLSTASHSLPGTLLRSKLANFRHNSMQNLSS